MPDRKFRFFALMGFISTAVIVLHLSPEAIGATAQSSPSAGDVSWAEALLLGVIQGLTEFLPISSTAHLKVVPVILGLGDPGVAFTAVIQLGSIAAVLWYFWQDLTQVVSGAIRAIRERNYTAPDFRMALGIALGTVPILFFGLLIKLLIPDFDNSPVRSVQSIAIASIVMSLLLGLAERLGQRQRNYEKLTMKDGILMGLAQALALMPGVSRSGSTLTAGLFMGLERAAAARFSFLLGIPAITLAGLVEMKGVLEEGLSGTALLPLALGVISAAVFSYLSIAWLLKYLQTQNTWVFVWYRLAFGLAILVSIRLGWLANL